jgi:soluble lytic murein transglycosylase-like protein
VVADIEKARRDAADRLARRFKMPEEVALAVWDAAIAHGFNPELVAALAAVESAYDTMAVSRVGARGIVQVMPATAVGEGADPSRLFELRYNLDVGLAYLNKLLLEHGGDIRLTLLSYNRGPGRVAFLVRRGVDPANGYATDIMGRL